MNILSLSTEFPNPSEPGKGLFVRARLQAVALRVPLKVVAPVALLDYANPRNELFGNLGVPHHRNENGIEVFHPRWIYPPYGGSLNALLLSARLLWPVARFRARQQCDVIDAHYAHPEGVAAAFLGLMLRVPFMVTIRGSELRYRQKWRRRWMGWALRKAGRVIAVSNGLRDLAIELGVDPPRVRVIPNGIKADVFFPRDGAECRRKHTIPADARVILCAGDLAELKGHHKVIRALKALADTGTSAMLVIAGGVGRSGRYADTLRKQVQENNCGDRVRFAGEMSQEALAELMCAADVFCLASRSEGWPNVVNEALACGTPVVATDVGAVRQMITSDTYGAIVPIEDHDALTKALRFALTNQWDRQAIAAWGRSRSWSQVAEEVIIEAEAVVREHQRSRQGRS